MSRTAAMSRYLTFAQEQLAGCTAGVPAGSAAPFGLGKIYPVPESMHGPADRTHGAKAVAIFQAALLAERQYRAANELGVLLAKFGRLPEAKNWRYCIVSSFLPSRRLGKTFRPFTELRRTRFGLPLTWRRYSPLHDKSTVTEARPSSSNGSTPQRLPRPRR